MIGKNARKKALKKALTWEEEQTAYRKVLSYLPPCDCRESEHDADGVCRNCGGYRPSLKLAASIEEIREARKPRGGRKYL